MTRITAFKTYDLRFLTSTALDGSDAMNPDPDYSAAYVVLETDGPHAGHGLTFTIGRGNEVVVAAIEALRNRTILAAGLDVFADEPQVPEALVALDNAVLLPHVGSATIHTRRAMGQLVVDNLVSWRDGKGPLTPVSETPWPREKA